MKKRNIKTMKDRAKNSTPAALNTDLESKKSHLEDNHIDKTIDQCQKKIIKFYELKHL